MLRNQTAYNSEDQGYVTLGAKYVVCYGKKKKFFFLAKQRLGLKYLQIVKNHSAY